MALVSLRQLLDHAAENGYGLPAFNVNNLEQIHAIMQAADECDSPVIMQGSAGARKYAGEAFLRHLIAAAVESYPHIPIVMHQDHGASPAVCINAIRSGFSSVMMDGSLEADAKTPSSYEYNVEVTAKVVEMAHAVGVSVEGELGCLGSLESGMGEAEDGHGAEGKLSHDQLLTDPEQAAGFCQANRRGCAWRLPLAPPMARISLRASRPATFSPFERDQGNPSAYSQHASGHAWLQFRTSGMARHHP